VYFSKTHKHGERGTITNNTIWNTEQVFILWFFVYWTIVYFFNYTGHFVSNDTEWIWMCVTKLFSQHLHRQTEQSKPGKIHHNSQSAHHFEHRIFQIHRSSRNSTAFHWRRLIIQSSTLTYEQHTKSMHSFPN
jgi:hypothetical protein